MYKLFHLVLAALFSTQGFAQQEIIDCEVIKSGQSGLETVEISLNEPLFTKVKTISDGSGSQVFKRERFITEAYVSSWKIDRKCESPCLCTVNQTTEEYHFSATCSGASALLMVDLQKMQGMYHEEFRPTNTTRTIPFTKCVRRSE